jgi:penicillin-binding protein 2
MTLTNRYPRILSFAFLLIALLVLPVHIADAAKKRKENNSRAKVSKRSTARAEKGRKVSAKDRRANNRREHLSARDLRRGKSRASAHLSRKELRRDRAQSAREQASLLKALERRRGRPLTKRERNAEMRRMGSQRRREMLEARRRAEAARRAAIARQRALDQALRDEVQGMISRDNTSGEDLQVRRVAINALGNHAGTVVVMDPMTGKVYSIVNQEWAVRRGFKPCSTIKLVTGVAGLSENVIQPSEFTQAADRPRNMDLTSALAHSDNSYFERVGSGIGFDKMIHYAREMGLGEKTGANVAFEYPGRLPEMGPGFALHRMFSYADGFEVTALQLGNLVSAMANGGKLLVPQVPTTQDSTAKIKPKVRRKLDIDGNVLQRMIPGMIGSVNYGSGRKAYDPLQTVAGKTGTCNGGGGSWVGLFTSYAPLANPKLAVVVITRGTDAHHHVPAAVAGQIYRDLHNRFGTPTNLQIASTPDDEEKELGSEDGNDLVAGQSDKATDDDDNSDEAAPAATHKLVPDSSPSNVKRVMNPINTPAQKIDTQKTVAPARPAVKPATDPGNRPRRTHEEQP